MAGGMEENKAGELGKKPREGFRSPGDFQCIRNQERLHATEPRATLHYIGMVLLASYPRPQTIGTLAAVQIQATTGPTVDLAGGGAKALNHTGY